MRIRKLSSIGLIAFLSTLIALFSGCNFIYEQDKKDIFNAYTAEDSLYINYTFKAEIKSIRNETIFFVKVDLEYFEQQYGDDEYATADGSKRWESAYSSFNHYAFELIPSSYRILVENGGYDLLTEGAEVTISANDYYGWAGWKFPILSLSIGENTYLDFDTGLENYLNYVNARFKDSY